MQNLRENFHDRVEGLCLTGLAHYKKIIRSYTLFHLSFSSFIGGLTLLFLYFLIYNPKSLVFAFILASLVLVLFSYFVLMFYFQAKKPDQFFSVRASFMQHCQNAIPHELSTADYHVALAQALLRFVQKLNKQEYHLLGTPRHFPSLQNLCKKLSFFWFWRDVHQMKELLLLEGINEHVQLVKQHPTDLEAHANLAHTYLSLSQLYKNDMEHSAEENPFTQEIKEKSNRAVKSAIQEYTIINHYAPNDPWVHAQLASCYHLLEQFKEELEQYEKILKLCPGDKEIMLRLGILYFKLGENARGLQMYETLKKHHLAKAQELIGYYDSYIKRPSNISL